MKDTRFQFRTWQVGLPVTTECYTGEVKDLQTGQIHSLPYNYPTRKEARQEAEALKDNLNREAWTLTRERDDAAQAVAQVRSEMLAAPKDSVTRARLGNRLRVLEDKLLNLFDGDVQAASAAEDSFKSYVQAGEGWKSNVSVEFNRYEDGDKRGSCNLCPYVPGGRGIPVTEVTYRTGRGAGGGFAVRYCDEHLRAVTKALKRFVNDLPDEGGQA
jgi:hypothetical protein